VESRSFPFEIRPGYWRWLDTFHHRAKPASTARVRHPGGQSRSGAIERRPRHRRVIHFKPVSSGPAGALFFDNGHSLGGLSIRWPGCRSRKVTASRPGQGDPEPRQVAVDSASGARFIDRQGSCGPLIEERFTLWGPSTLLQFPGDDPTAIAAPFDVAGEALRNYALPASDSHPKTMGASAAASSFGH